MNKPENSRTPAGKLGLIEHLTRNIVIHNSSTVTGVALTGHMTVPDRGCFLITNRYDEVELMARGWEKK